MTRVTYDCLSDCGPEVLCVAMKFVVVDDDDDDDDGDDCLTAWSRQAQADSRNRSAHTLI